MIQPLVRFPGKQAEMEVSWCSCNCPGRRKGKEQGKQREKASLSALPAEGLTSCDLVGSPVGGMPLRSSPNEFRELGLWSLTRICHWMGDYPGKELCPYGKLLSSAKAMPDAVPPVRAVCLSAALPKAVVINL